MTTNQAPEFKAAFAKTITFLMNETDTLSQNTAVEILGKSENEIRIILNSVMTDFWNMGIRYFIQEISKRPKKQQGLE